MDRPERVRALKAALATLDGGVSPMTEADLRSEAVPGASTGGKRRSPQTTGETGDPGHSVVPVPRALADCLPGGGLPRRAITTVADCPAFIIELLAAATGRGSHVAVVGWPDLLLTGVADAGGILDSIVVVPDPGDRPFSVVGMLVEGMDLVVHRSAGSDRVSATQARPLLARVRRGTAALLVVGARFPASAVRIGADITAYHGVGAGSGRIRGFDLSVEVVTKGAPPREVLLRVGRGPGTDATGVVRRTPRIPGLQVVRAG
ncbi:hypothetical protein [Corynebacterium antarcticum]|uniref:Uncharacterized protein n=1 Tax=Corynebacterium antarcticum TaxID=2800405 RepID=A0A9Q4CCC8_9CORY|nr:hypothetical protein [Corynebacterium antarcticum]MCX7538176.1 hypothetical protein [Corynebacterium antarcticum]MCX7540341.1 hypothetical protein [Corynebacterium antarcticum]